MLAILLALFGSFWFAVSMIFINRGVLAVDYFKGLLANLGINALCLCVFLSLSADRIDLWASANLLFVVIGIFVPGVSRFLFSKEWNDSVRPFRHASQTAHLYLRSSSLSSFSASARPLPTCWARFRS